MLLTEVWGARLDGNRASTSPMVMVTLPFGSWETRVWAGTSSTWSLSWSIMSGVNNVPGNWSEMTSNANDTAKSSSAPVTAEVSASGWVSLRRYETGLAGGRGGTTSLRFVSVSTWLDLKNGHFMIWGSA